MKKILIGLFTIIVMTQLQANAFDWNTLFKFWDTATEAQTTEVQTVKTFADINNQMATIDKSVQDAFINIVSDLSTWREERSIKSELKAKNANLTDIISNYTTMLANNKEAYTKEAKKLSAKEKTALVNNLAILSEDAQKYLLLATDGVKTAANTLKTTQKLSEAATTISNINKTANELKTRATTVVNMANQIKTIATAAGISVK